MPVSRDIDRERSDFYSFFLGENARFVRPRVSGAPRDDNRRSQWLTITVFLSANSHPRGNNLAL